MALVYYDQGRFPEAMTMNTKALELMKKQLGEEHIQVAEIYHNMGNILRTINFAECMEMLDKALQLKSKILSPAHASIGDTHCRKGDAFLANSHLDKALESYQKAL
ncbi:unnamed protein product [Cylindrotheca closterium]|uniref:Kinesin light chain n=1 Tax=Cylindrotheca closterium TaxID=2856 RepID=A0AAD2FQ43_9STRA|nr:unnamed protein product [Cylindrotheca closterium]